MQPRGVVVTESAQSGSESHILSCRSAARERPKDLLHSPTEYRFGNEIVEGPSMVSLLPTSLLPGQQLIHHLVDITGPGEDAEVQSSFHDIVRSVAENGNKSNREDESECEDSRYWSECSSDEEGQNYAAGAEPKSMDTTFSSFSQAFRDGCASFEQGESKNSPSNVSPCMVVDKHKHETDYGNSGSSLIQPTFKVTFEL